MEKKLGSYETLFAVNATLPEEEIKATTDKFLSLIADNGTVATVDEWGKRRLAYPINDVNEGIYVRVVFEAPAAFPAELERIYGITDAVLRSIVVRLDEVKAEAPATEEAAAE